MDPARLTRTLLIALFAAQVSMAAAETARADSTVERAAKASEKIVFAGGCFWGMEAVFEQLKGVSNVVAGYSGGDAGTAHYDMVSTGSTGHAESVEVTYDTSQVSFGQLLAVYFLVAHDPTTLNRQGPDWGTQYRSVIFYSSRAQQRAAQTYISALASQKTFSDKIVTDVVPLHAFYPAEDYHQHFIDHNPNYPYVVINDLPKLATLRQKFPDMVKHN